MWLQGLFNFKPSVRPVPLEAHIQGYPGKFYCPRMATMNKPTYAAIQLHSPVKPVLVFVSSRRCVPCFQPPRLASVCSMAVHMQASAFCCIEKAVFVVAASRLKLQISCVVF